MVVKKSDSKEAALNESEREWVQDFAGRETDELTRQRRMLDYTTRKDDSERQR